MLRCSKLPENVLFIFQQVRDIHLKIHKDLKEPAFKLPCMECGHEFYSGEAVKYHSQSFHRKAHVFQDVQTPPPSNKIYLNGHGDLLSVYYCHLCGQEYVIKYNLQVNITYIISSLVNLKFSFIA